MNSLFRSPFVSQPSATAVASTVSDFSGSYSSIVPTWGWTAAAVVFALLALEQAVYRRKKGVLPGPNWTIPLVGKFIDSMYPSMQKYQNQWDSGALSAVSIFNM
jgi:C-22 sterol desaturase